MARVTVNSHPHAFADSHSVLDLPQPLDIPIPALCHDPRIRDAGAWRLCLVQIESMSRPVTACSTPLLDGMLIRRGRHT